MNALTLMKPYYGLFDRFNSRLWDDEVWSNLDDQYKVEIELPRFKKDQVKITLSDRILKIEAKSKDLHYYNGYSLPSDVELEKIEAQLEDGLLTITMPRKEKSQRIITVK